MDIVSGGFYIVKDEFFDYVNDPNLLRNHEDGPRPHYLAFRDSKTNLILMIPCTSKVERYMKISKRINRRYNNSKNQSQREEFEKKKLGFRFYHIAGKDGVVVFEKMFLISDEFIDHAFYNHKSIAMVNPEDYDSFQKQANRVLDLIRSGFKFMEYQPNFELIESLMLHVKH